MFIGDTLHVDGNSDVNPAIYYSPWFPRGGNRGRFTCNVVSHGGGFDDFLITVQTKNSEQSDKSAEDATNPTWTQAITLGINVETTWIAGQPLDDATNVGLLELVRFKYELLPAGAVEAWVHFRILQPQWFTN